MSEENSTQESPKVSRAGKILRRTAWITGGVFGVLLLLAVCALLLRNMLVEHTVEKVAPMVTGTPVEVGSFHSDLFKGEIVLKGFRIGNPEGYVEPHAIVLDTLRIRLQPGSLMKNTIIVSEIFISGVGVNFELKADGSSNLTDLQKNVENFTKSVAPQEKTEKAEPEPAADDAPHKELIIEQLRQEQGFVSASIGLTNSTMKLPLPAIEMTDIGGGQSIGETVSVLFSELMLSVGKALSTAGLNMENLKDLGSSVLKTISDGGNVVMDGGNLVLQGGEKGTKVVIEGVGDSGKAVIDGVNKLFKKK